MAQAASKALGLKEIISKREPLSAIEKFWIVCIAARKLWSKLSDDIMLQKIHQFSVLRDNTFDEACQRLIETGFSMLPTNADRLDFAGKGNTVVSARVTAPVKFKIETSDGYTFVDWEGSDKQYANYWLFRDKVPRHFTPLTFATSSAVYRSFVHGDCRVPGDAYLPKEGGTIIEAGAYVGYKAIAFGRRVGPTGKVLAIELDPENHALLQENVSLNGMETHVFTRCCAVWSDDTILPFYGRNRMNNSVASVDEKKPPQKGKVPAYSLDTIIIDSGFEHVDYINLQLNGAEVDALAGLQVCWGRVGYVNIITRFHQDGVLVVDKARELIESRGGRIVVDERVGHLFNLTAQINIR